MDHTNPPISTQNSNQPSSDNPKPKEETAAPFGFIPFTESQLTTLMSRQTKYFTEARTKINYDLELASQLDDRVQAAIKSGKTVKIASDLTGFICE